jgi:phosphoribosyl-dephospho-CoA transferase
VIRRAATPHGLIPVGVRGGSRAQRFASWISTNAILEYVTPQMLVSRRAWGDTARREVVPAFAALDDVVRIMREHHLEGYWGPGGSVGFELASGTVTATLNSDLDLIIRTGSALTGERARSLSAALSSLAVRADVLLEMPQGAIALSEYARMDERPGSFVLRTTRGPRLVGSPAEL